MGPITGPAATDEGAGAPSGSIAVSTTWSAPRLRVRRASTYEAPPSDPPISEEPMMSSQPPPEVAPPRPVAGAAVGPAVPSSVSTIWAGMPPLPTTKAVEAVPATERTSVLTRGMPLPSGRVTATEWGPGGTGR